MGRPTDGRRRDEIQIIEAKLNFPEILGGFSLAPKNRQSQRYDIHTISIPSGVQEYRSSEMVHLMVIVVTVVVVLISSSNVALGSGASEQAFHEDIKAMHLEEVRLKKEDRHDEAREIHDKIREKVF